MITRNLNNQKTPLQTQRLHIKKLRFSNYYGIEWLLRFLLIILRYTTISLYLYQIIKFLNYPHNKIVMEIYVFIKMILPIAFFVFSIYSNKAVFYLNLYLMVESILIVSSIIINYDIVGPPDSFIRSINRSLT